MRVLTTGGAGFIGSHLIDKLTSEGHEVTDYGYIWNNRKRFLNPKCKYMGGNILKKFPFVPKNFGINYDIVYHLASNSDISRSVESPSLDFENGTRMTFEVLQTMRYSDIPKIVFFSGSGVYGIPDFKGIKVAEEYAPLLPISHYGASKLACEAMISAFSHLYGFKSYILRPANIVGARQTHGVILDFINKLKRDPTRLEILGNGQQTKSYLHVSDLLKAIDAILSEKRKVNIFNVGNEDGLSVYHIAKIIIFEMNLKDVEIKTQSQSYGWFGDVPNILLDSDNLHRLGWYPALTSRESVIKATKELLEEKNFG